MPKPTHLLLGLLLGVCTQELTQAQTASALALTQVPPQSEARRPSATQPLDEVLQELKSAYNITFFYRSQLTEGKVLERRRPTFSSLNEALAYVAQHSDLRFERLNNGVFVILAKNEVIGSGPLNSDSLPQTIVPSVAGTALATPSLTPRVLTAAPTDIVVTGRVLQANGEPVPGATVLVKGGTQGTATGSDGTFSLSVPEGSTLVISSVGFLTQEVLVSADNPDVNVSLKEDTQGLKEVVVVGYGTQKRDELTTSVASVGAQAIERQPVAGFDQALQGQAAGVQVTAPSGAPGAGINIRIRGISTVNLNSSPLYVIDGVPVLPTYDREIGVGNQKPNPLNTLNPADIESIDILKDGAAAAIYGLRASNGVVVITTKHGRVGKAQVTFNTYVGVQSLRKKIDMLNSSQFSEYYNEAAAEWRSESGLYSRADCQSGL